VKKEFFCVYDYGIGGVWVIILARSKKEIAEKYPMLGVEENRPKWMSDADYNRFRANHFYDIDDTDAPAWLLDLRGNAEQHKINPTEARLYVKKIGDRYSFRTRAPLYRDYSSERLLDLREVIEKLQEAGCHPTDIQDVVTEADRYGEGYLP
jgi:hypothetical protein